MDVFEFRFTAAQLRPSPYLGFLIASGHCCNELAILLPYIVFEHDITKSNDAETSFILTRKFVIDRILISKIVEYGDLCSRFLRDNNNSADDILIGIAENYEPIAVMLRAAKWARILRNKISFHYDREHALASLSRLEDDHPLKFVAGRIKGLTLFDFAEEIVVRPIFEEAGSGDIGAGMDVAQKFILKLINSITSFHAQTTKCVFGRFGLITELVQTTLDETYCGNPDENRIPISISSGYISSFESDEG
jgi:hypothetical protein